MQTLLHFPSIDDASNLTSPFDVVQVNISLLFFVLLFPGFLVHGLLRFGRSAGCQGHHPRNKKTNSQCFASSKQNRILVAAYNITPRQAIKEENRKNKSMIF